MYREQRAGGLIVFFLIYLGSLVLVAEADDGWVRVVPDETDEILANPGMGWETFHRTAASDKNLPPWIPSTVHYARWGWGELEPTKGHIDYAFLDGVLKESRESGQTLAFRAMCCSTTPSRPYHPRWLKDCTFRKGNCLPSQRN